VKKRTLVSVLGCAGIVLAACGVSSSANVDAALPVNYSRIVTAPDGARFATVKSFAHTQVVENDGSRWYLGTPTGVSTRKGLVLAVGPDSRAWAAEIEHGTLFFSTLFVGPINHWHPQVMSEGIGQSPGALWPVGPGVAYAIEGDAHYGEAKQRVVRLGQDGATSATVATVSGLLKMEAKAGCGGAELEGVVSHGTSPPEVLALCHDTRRALVMDTQTHAESIIIAPHKGKFLGFSSFVDHYGVPLIAAVTDKGGTDSVELYLQQGGAKAGPMTLGLAMPLPREAASGPSLASTHGNVVVVVPESGGASEVIAEIHGTVSHFAGPHYGQGAGVSATGVISVVAANPDGTSVKVEERVDGKWTPVTKVGIPTGSGVDDD